MSRPSRSVKIVVQNATRSRRVPAAAKLRAWTLHALERSAHGEITLRIVGERESAALNARYRGKRGSTNVLSFNAEVAPVARGEWVPFGALVICAAVVAREARTQRKSLLAHWAHMVVHGALHLQGYDHEKRQDAKVMEARERSLLGKLGFPDPYSIN